MLGYREKQELREAVERRAALLDKKDKQYHRKVRWWERVNMRQLDLGCTWDCVLGQLYGDYMVGKEKLFQGSVTQSVQHGFTLVSPLSDRMLGYAVLEREWRRAMRQRRQTQGG